MSTDITLTQLQAVVPKNLKNNINQDFVDKINGINIDPGVRESFMEGILSYTTVLAQGRFKLENYIDAVRYVSHKLLGVNNKVAYIKTFPTKYDLWLATGVTEKDIATYISAYNKSKLVNLIFEQTLVPSHVLNADKYQKSINVMFDIMTDEEVSPKVRSDTASNLATLLKPPEATKVEIDLGVTESKTIQDLKATMGRLVHQQKEMLEDKLVNAKEVAEAPLVIENASGEIVE